MVWTKLSFIQKIELLKNIILESSFELLDHCLRVDIESRNYQHNDFKDVLDHIKTIIQRFNKEPEMLYRISFIPGGKITLYNSNDQVLMEERIESKANLLPADFYLFTDKSNQNYLIDVDQHL